MDYGLKAALQQAFINIGETEEGKESHCNLLPQRIPDRKRL